MCAGNAPTLSPLRSPSLPSSSTLSISQPSSSSLKSIPFIRLRLSAAKSLRLQRTYFYASDSQLFSPLISTNRSSLSRTSYLRRNKSTEKHYNPSVSSMIGTLAQESKTAKEAPSGIQKTEITAFSERKNSL